MRRLRKAGVDGRGAVAGRRSTARHLPDHRTIWLAERDRLLHGGAAHDDPVPSHRAVVDALRERDESAAETAMRELLDKAVRDVEKARGRRGSQ